MTNWEPRSQELIGFNGLI